MDLLSRGTEEQVRNRVRDILTTCGNCGGYILGSGNTIANYVPLTNFFAMIDEGHRFNRRNL
jgi:uroporphyrinogen decarboxylase